MTSAVPFSRPVRSPERPGDAERAPRELMTLPGFYRDERRWRLVEIRLGGRWRPGLLTVWRRPPGSAVWVVHVTWGPEGTGPGEEAWGWFLFDKDRIRPLPEPTDPAPTAAPYLGTWRDAVRVPAELAGPAGTDPSERCWRLAWLRADDAWRSVLVTARRRPAPQMPWIAHARWGEDKQAGWVIADGTALRPLTQDVPVVQVDVDADAEDVPGVQADADVLPEPAAAAVPSAPVMPAAPGESV
ncbi:hypothetical protein ACIF6L_34140 [Kitasatospora sp. NPDC086009]|uniref:hypothetical protein n=1 Tax=unclassified Kitasatospora TaxID=2633591 RepID=UPI0037C58A44